jgi:DNA-binding CsgD family transcriptional regulator
MKRLVDRFAAEAGSCATLDQLRSLLSNACHELGFEYFALLHHVSLSAPSSAHLRIDNYPEGWANELTRSGLAADDPVHFASRRANTGFAWSEIDSIVPLGARHRAVLSRSRHFGIGEGFTVPANVPQEPAGSCSFAVRHSRELPFKRLMCAELIGGHAFRAARELIGVPLRPARPHLSPRERGCLQLVARGKTDWEISVILGISLDTARQYVKRARKAYDVATRTQLAVLGLRDNWVEFDDAIPPSG